MPSLEALSLPLWLLAAVIFFGLWPVSLCFILSSPSLLVSVLSDICAICLSLIKILVMVLRALPDNPGKFFISRPSIQLTSEKPLLTKKVTVTNSMVRIWYLLWFE
jgi:hypothetical protein